nr:GrpB family protein [uncultured Sellimonas sp.]
MSLGLKRGTVKLEPHDEQWEYEAQKTICVLKKVLGKDAMDIQHIGSTSITSILAKPIIDLVVGVNDFALVSKHNDELEKQGIYFRSSDIANQLLYVMGDFDQDTRTHYIHVVIWNGIEWKNYINFRDFLNKNKDVALQYQVLKEKLESQYGNDRNAYTKGKEEMIQSILERARQ